MDSRSDILMLGGVAAFCADCDDQRIFVPVDGYEFCCTTCDAAVFMLEVVDNTGARLAGVA